MSDGTGDSALGNKWLGRAADQYLIDKGSSQVALLVNAASQLTFTGSGSPVTYAAPDGNSLRLEHDSTNKEFILTDIDGSRYDVFHDFTVAGGKSGKLKERSTREWNSQSKAGFGYTYTAGGDLSQITTPAGQDFNIAFTYTSSRITKVEVKNASSVLIQQADYTYYDDVTTPSTDLGSSGDLVQVKMSSRTTADTAGTLSIVRYTQYRYDAASRLKAVYEHDALQRIIDQTTGITSEADILTKADTYGTVDIQEYANRRFTYYTANTATNSIDTPFGLLEDLNTTYGGSEAAESGYVKSEIIRTGCGSCGSTSGITKSYFYLDIAQGATLDQNEVTRLVVEDTEDSGSNAHSRTVFGLNDSGRQLRKVFIDDPTGTPAYWCESWKMATTGQAHRIAEYRMPSAHNVSTAAALRNYLDPYDSEGDSWTNDTNTLNASAGLIYVNTYNSDGAKTDVQVKQGRTGTAYYTSAADYGDGDGDTAGDDNADNVLLVAQYAYFTKTATRTDGKKTSYAYTFWDTDDREIKTRTTTLPSIATSQNGSGTATTIVEYYDNLGRLRWTQDGEGYINYYAYHPVTGAAALTVIDINPASVSTDVSSGSTGEWEAWTVGSANTNKPTRGSLPTALALTSKTYYDELGRQTRSVDPGGDEHYTAYENTRTLSFPYWDSTNSKTLLPIRAAELSFDETNVGETYAVKAGYTSITVISGAPVGFSTEPSQSDYVSWTTFTRDGITGSLKQADRYHDIPTSGTGTLSTNFYRSVTQTDALGRTEYTIQVVSGSSAGDRKEQVTQRIYDVRSRVITIKQGVSGDTAANSHNMTDTYDTYPTLATLSETIYDDGGIGDGRVTQSRRYHGTGTNDYTGINYHRTYRGHVRGLEPFYMNVSTETASSPVMVNDVNWQGQTTDSGTYTASPTWTTVLTGDGYTAYTTTTTNRRALTETSYDDLGRAYRSDRYAINQSTGALSNSLRTDMFYDRLSRVVASGDLLGGTATELAYDGAGRQYQSRTVLELEATRYASGAFSYRVPTPDPTLSSMTAGDDKVVTLSHSVFDSSGNVTEQHAFDMNHDDATAGIDLTNNDDYVRRSVYSWYDQADRLQTVGNYGSGDTTAGAGQWKYAAVPTRPGTAPTASSDTVLVTLYAYHADTGRPETVTDPSGIKAKTFIDDLGRSTWTAENYADFVPTTLSTISDATDDSKDRVTNTVYDGLGQTTKLIAYNGSSTAAQDTLYLFENSVSAARVTNTIYPDSSDTTSAGTDQVKLTYNTDGSTATRTDQRGTVIAFSYDNLRRPQSQKVTTLGGSTDGAVRSITRGYDSLGRNTKITSHGNQTDDPDNTTDIANQIVYSYNGLHLVSKSQQSHQGAASGSSPDVDYGLDDSAVGGVYNDGARPFYLNYPDGRLLHFDYGTADALEDRFLTPQRLRETNGTGTILVEYSHAGSGRSMITDYQQPDVKLDLYQGTSGTYAGLDRFGRTIDQFWDGYGSTADVTRVKYGHDYAGNRTWREDIIATNNTQKYDELYTYDGLHRLADFERGVINGTYTTITSDTFGQDWDLDQLGNWANFLEDSDGDATDDLDQDRTHNDVNEITAITATTGANWADPTHDAAGNMITGPTPGAETSTQKYVYDAWNRLVKVTDGADTAVGVYEYDGRNYRITKAVYAAGVLSYTDHFYYNEDWQALEVRREISGTEDPDPREQYTWHPDYIDALAVRTYDADTDGILAENNDGTHYYTQGANYHVLAVTDSSGTVLERYHYDPYGRLIILDADFTPDADNNSDIDNPYTFTGRRLDALSGQYYYRYRYYDVATGRFLNRDPILYVGGPHLYEYVRSIPTSYYDPLGLRPAHTNDEKQAIKRCNGDPDCEKAVRELFDLLDDTPPPGYFTDACDRYTYGGGCVVWRMRCRTKYIQNQCGGSYLKTFCNVEKHYYTGWNPFWSEHHWLNFTYDGQIIFYADDHTLGGDDHIFFDYDEDLFPVNPPFIPLPGNSDWYNYN